MLKKILALTALLVLTAPVHADFVDHGLYVSDTETGLDWLKWSETAGLSLDEVQSELSVGGLYDGWEMASSYQLWTMLDPNEFYFSVVNLLPPEERFWFNFDSLGSFESERAFTLDLLDTTYDSEGVYVDSLYEATTAMMYCTDPPNPTNGKTGACYLDYFDTAGVEWSSTSDANLSTALFRPSMSVIPVPASIWLFGSFISVS